MKVTIEKLDHFGRGICYINDKICFVKEALPGEVVDIDITLENKKYLEANIKKMIQKSSHRIKSPCKSFPECGGCCFQHYSYEEENRYKKDKMIEIIDKFAHLDPKLVKDVISSFEMNYRNKIILHGMGGKLGFYEEKTHSVIPIDECLLISPRMNEIIKNLKSINVQILEALIRSNNDDSMIMVELEGKVSDIELLKPYCDVLIYNGMILTEQDEFISTIGSKKFYLSYSSFFQVNRFLTKDLYDAVLKVVKIKKPMKLLDLYCGTGTIGIYVSDYAKEIVGIDNNGSNIKDANKNKELNQVSSISFICDKVENQIDSFDKIDFIVVDPPRNGLDSKTVDSLLKINPETIVYVSCDPVTLARDLNILKESYLIQYIQPFNMFPRSYHCESVCVLERRSN
ncbi:MAG: class I SAM-dependent RNA methyltransferase [Bacilli bacterium]|nr:class I SAM-dependent RNA methyltransferase [Bacilli bacterium]